MKGRSFLGVFLILLGAFLLVAVGRNRGDALKKIVSGVFK